MPPSSSTISSLVLSTTRSTRETESQRAMTKGDGSKSAEDSTIATDRNVRFWEKYSEEASEYDKDFLRKNRDSLTAVMLFAGLFSAVAASFLVAVQGNLQPNPTDTTNALLKILIDSVDNTTFAGQDLGVPVWNGPSLAIICSQSLGYAALSTSLLAALGAVLATQWLSDFIRIRSGLLQERCRRHQQKLDGLETWKFHIFMEALPALIQLALLLFGISLAIYLWELNRAVGSVVIVSTGIGLSFYLYITLASLLSPECPYHTPISSAIHRAIETIMKSAEEVTEYWVWRSDRNHQVRPAVHSINRILAHIITIFFPPLLTILPTVTLKPSRSRFHTAIRWLHDSARRVRIFVRGTYLDPQPKPSDSDPRAIVWLMERSKDRENLLAASELVLDVKWPEDLDTSLATEHVYISFFRSIPDLTQKPKYAPDRNTLLLGKALIYMLCRVSKEAGNHVWTTALKRVKEALEKMKTSGNSDFSFILTILGKLLSLKQGLQHSEIEFPTTSDVSPKLLSWMLQPLEILLRLEFPAQSRFLSEAHCAFQRLEFPDEEDSRAMYCRTFELYFDSVIGTSCMEIDRTYQRRQLTPEQLQIDCLNRILQRLKEIPLLRPPYIYHELLVPLRVLSGLASIRYLRPVFNDATINPWMIKAFKMAVRGPQANGSGEMWPFASHIMDLATVSDSFRPVYVPISRRPSMHSAQVVHVQRIASAEALRIDSETILSYLLNKESPDTVVSTGQIDYGMKIVLSNAENHLDVASNLSGLAAKYGIVQLLRDAILKRDSPEILKSFLRIDDQNFKSDFLKTLKSDLGGDPLSAVLTRLDEEPNKIPLRDLRHLEISLVLSMNGDQHKSLCNHLDCCIWALRTSQAQGCNPKDRRVLPLTIVVGWLLREDGPLIASGHVWKAFLRPDMEDLLLPVWKDLKYLRDNPWALRLVLNFTARWFSVSKNGSSESPLVANSTLKKLSNALERAKEEISERISDINTGLGMLSVEANKYIEASSQSKLYGG